MAQILDGRLLARQIKNTLQQEVVSLKQKLKKIPQLVNLMIGEDAASSAYANSQKKAAQEIGITYELQILPASILLEELIAKITQLNKNKDVHGIMLHKPLPGHIDYRCVVSYIDPIKDIEGMNPTNLGKIILGEFSIVPSTPAAVMEHLRTTKVNMRGKEAVVLGRSDIVGKPLSLLLLKEEATVTICHRGTSLVNKLAEHIHRADILVAAIGQPFFVKGEWIKEGAIIIDVGINQFEGEIVGDVDFNEAQKRASFITPVPGGVGPVTVVMLIRNLIETFKLQNRIT